MTDFSKIMQVLEIVRKETDGVKFMLERIK